MPLTLHLTNGTSYAIGTFRINGDGTLDAWQTAGESPEGWLGVLAPHAWQGVIADTDEPDEPLESGEVVPLRGA